MANLTSKVVEDSINYSQTGHWNSSWEDYVGAIFGGVAGGTVFLFTRNLSLSFGVMGATTSISTDILTNVTGKTNKSSFDIIGSAFSAGLIGFVSGAIFGETNIIGLNAGRNSYISIFKSGISKLLNKTAKKMSFKVLMKGITSITLLKVIDEINDTLIKYIINSTINLTRSNSGVSYA